jgi:hypothetical protein
MHRKGKKHDFKVRKIKHVTIFSTKLKRYYFGLMTANDRVLKLV